MKFNYQFQLTFYGRAIVFPYTHDTGTVTGTEPGVEFYTLPLIVINIAAFQHFNTALFKTNFNYIYFN